MNRTGLRTSIVKRSPGSQRGGPARLRPVHVCARLSGPLAGFGKRFGSLSRMIAASVAVSSRIRSVRYTSAPGALCSAGLVKLAARKDELLSSALTNRQDPASRITEADCSRSHRPNWKPKRQMPYFHSSSK